MKTYARYLAREIVTASLLVLFGFLALFVFFDFVAELQDLGKGGYRIQHAMVFVLLVFVLLTLPGRVYELMPIGVLIGALYALTNLSRNSEITVLRTSGLSTGRLLLSLVQIGLVFVVLTFLIGEYVAPYSEKAGRQFRLNATSAVVGQDFRSGLWIKDETRACRGSASTTSTGTTSCGPSATLPRAYTCRRTAGASPGSCARSSSRRPRAWSACPKRNGPRRSTRTSLPCFW